MLANIGKEKEKWVECCAEDDGCIYCYTIDCWEMDCDECIMNPNDGYDLEIEMDELKRLNRVKE